MTMSLNSRPQEAWDAKREVPEEASVVSNANSNTDSKKKRSWKKPKDKPMRPLSAYNMFFQNQRERIVAGKTGDPTPEEIQQSVIKMLTSKTRGPKRRQDRVSHGQISFGDLARAIAAKWKTIDPKLKAVYNHFAAQEKVRYKKEVVIWKEKKEKEHGVALAAKQHSLLASSGSYNDSMMSFTSSVTSASTAMSTSYNMSESFNSVQGGMGMQGMQGMQGTQVTDDVVRRQQDILRQQMGFVDSKPHASTRMGGNGTVSRNMPQLEHDMSGGNNTSRLQEIEFPCPNPIGGNGQASSMNYSNSKPSEKLSQSGSLLDSNQLLAIQQQQFSQKEQLLLQLQHQQLQQLQHLQQARNETSRLSNMKTTDTFVNCMQPSKMTDSKQEEFPTPSLNPQAAAPISSNPQLREQFKELEFITFELDRLKEKLQEQKSQTNTVSLWSDEMVFADSLDETTSVLPTGNFDPNTEYTSNLNDTNISAPNSSMTSTFDMDDRQRSVRRSRSGDTNVYRGRLKGSNQLNGATMSGDQNGQKRQPRRHSMFGSVDGTGGNSGFSSAPSSFNYGRNNLSQNPLSCREPVMGECSQQVQHQQQQQQQGQNEGRRDSLAALMHLDDRNNNIGGVASDQSLREQLARQARQLQQLQQQEHQLQHQQQQNSLAALSQMQYNTQGGNNVGHQDIGSMFSMDPGIND